MGAAFDHDPKTTTISGSGTILVVDDQSANLRVVSALLSRQGYAVLTAGDGERALELVRQARPDLVLLDMMMPGMDGFGVLDQIRREQGLRQLPVVFLTAAHDRELLIRAFEAGVVDYITKPFMPEELLARVSAHVGLKLARDHLEQVAGERQRLVNLVAHDLKNPLASVLFASDILLHDGCRPERVPRYLQMIHESAQDALGYIRNYLEIQAAQAGTAATAEIDRDGVCLHTLFDWLRDRYALQLESRGRRLRIADIPECPHVAMDGLVLRQVAENLVTNAMKYAPDSDIDLSLRPGRQGAWQILVEDRGPGVAASDRDALFLPFNRLNRASDGLSSGLGLSLARQILGRDGGDLWYEDRNGGGARFVIEVPAMAPAAH